MSEVHNDWDLNADVVVLGFGFAGLSAAISAHDQGAKVIIFEKMPKGREGGNSRVSGNTWFSYADKEGIAAHLRALSAHNPVPEPMIDVWIEETGRNTEWIQGLGGETISLAFHSEFPYLETSKAYTGIDAMAAGWGHGNQWKFLVEQVAARQIAVRFGAPAKRLLTSPDGSVIGVLVEEDGRQLTVRAARGIVLATGGFEANSDMVRDYLGLDDAHQLGSPGNTGDGHKMAQAAGADLWHMNNYMPISGLVAPDEEAAFEIVRLTWSDIPVEGTGGATDGIYGKFVSVPVIFVGKDGRRFENESVFKGHGHGLLHGRIELFPNRPMWVIIDQRAIDDGPLDGPVDLEPWGWNKLVNGYVWDPANQAEIDKGWILKGNTIAELAEKLSVDSLVLEETITSYNKGCSEGRDAYGRSPETLLPFGTGPYYAFYSGPVIYYTNGGPRKNERAQVINGLGEPIGGLFIAGEASSTYTWAMEAGMMIADAMAFGRIAGRNAARERAH